MAGKSDTAISTVSNSDAVLRSFRRASRQLSKLKSCLLLQVRENVCRGVGVECGVGDFIGHVNAVGEAQYSSTHACYALGRIPYKSCTGPRGKQRTHCMGTVCGYEFLPACLTALRELHYSVFFL